MTHKTWWYLGGAAACLLALTFWGLRGPRVVASPPSTSAPPPAPPPGTWPLHPPATAARDGTPASATPEAPPATAPQADDLSALAFRLSPQGHLQLDQRTRLDLDRLQARLPRDAALARLKALTRDWPPAAQRELMDLFLLYSQYAQAVSLSFPPADRTGPLDALARQFDALRALRRQYFSEETAQALFGEEEKATLGLFEVLRKPPEPQALPPAPNQVPSRQP